MDENGEGEGIIDNLMDALKTGQAFNRDNRRKNPRQNRKYSLPIPYSYLAHTLLIPCPYLTHT